MEAFVIINIVFVFLSGYWAQESFRNGYQGAGWVNLFASAINMAAVLAHFTKALP
jgi:Na+-driven multidrug efflux pump